MNLYSADLALQEAVAREGGGWATEALTAFGALTGSAEYLELGHLANKFGPEFDPQDRFGNRVDLAKYHPSYHQLMQSAIEHGIHAAPWSDPRPGAHVARAAHFYLQSQVEAGHGCPITMTFAAIPALRLQPDLAAVWEPKITSRVYDPRNVPIEQKQGVTLGMGMTEKQGGSDVRSNTTRAYAVGQGGPVRRMNWSATSSSSPPPCATPSWCWRRRRAASAASSCRAGDRTAARTRCRCCA